MRSFTWISINRWILKEFNKLKKKKQKHNSLQKMTHSSKLRNSVSMPSINLLPLRINVLYSIFPFTSPSFRKKWRLTLKFQFSLPWESNKLKKKEAKPAKINSLFRSTFFFHLCSFERKKEYDVEASPYRSFRYIHVRLSLESRKQIPKAWHGAKRERCEFSGRGRAC